MSSNQDQAFIEVMLNNWGLSEYIEIFKKNKVTKEGFMHMPEKFLNLLIPEIGSQFTFVTERQKLLTDTQFENAEGGLRVKVCKSALDPLASNAEDEGLDQSTSTHVLDEDSILLSLINNETVGVPAHSPDTTYGNVKILTPIDINQAKGNLLRQLLQNDSDPSAEQLLAKKVLADSDRDDLATIVGKYMLKTYKKQTPEVLQFWTDEICALYNRERPGVYYSPYDKESKTAPRGKLYNKVHNVKKKLNKSKGKKRKRLQVDQGSQVQADSEKGNEFSIEKENAISKLKTLSIDNKQQILTLWEETHHLRKDENDIAKYMSDFPVLCSSLGCELLMLDFDLMKIAEPQIFFKTWPVLSKKIIKLAKDKNVWDMNLDDLDPEVAALFILSNLFSPSTLKGTSKRYKPSGAEQAAAFLLTCPAVTYMREKIEKRKEFLKSKGLTFQPTIVVIGTPNEIDGVYIYINEKSYLFSSLVGAVDVCFKIFHALNAQYPADAEIVWMFLEAAVYKIKSNKPSPIRVETVMTDLESIDIAD